MILVGKVFLFSGRIIPFVIDSCENINLENITLRNGGSMGIICQLSKNISLDKIDISLCENSLGTCSINCDATHFVGCNGKITITNRQFDKINIFSNSHNLVKSSCTVKSSKLCSENTIVIEVDSLIDIKVGDIIENITTTPEVLIENNEVISSNTHKKRIKSKLIELDNCINVKII